MSSPNVPESRSTSSQAKAGGFWPRSTLSWIAAALGVAALSSWVIFPVISMTFRDSFPVVDTWVMPALATTLVDAAAVLNAVIVWYRRERSLVNIAMLIATILAGLFFTFLVVGEAIAGV